MHSECIKGGRKDAIPLKPMLVGTPMKLVAMISAVSSGWSPENLRHLRFAVR